LANPTKNVCTHIIVFGGNATCGASVSKAFLIEAWKWFEEEGGSFCPGQAARKRIRRTLRLRFGTKELPVPTCHLVLHQSD
jgi:hypothetical protein